MTRVVGQTGGEGGQALARAKLRESGLELECILSVPTTHQKTSERAGRACVCAHCRVLRGTQSQRTLCGFQAALRARQRYEIRQIEQRTRLHVDETIVGRPRSQGLVVLDGAQVERRPAMRGQYCQQLRL